ncbi:hypothetical protein BC832DRAFT_538844 [Gaertneriomyces semiglobifer]|nr:hypothetical protein BC832DRAFT_538844 [Gaertneriomyces semiglobifer]
MKVRKPPCPVCRSRRYRKAGDGFYYCELGHQLQGYVEEVGDDEAAAASHSRRQSLGRRSPSVERNKRRKRYKRAPLSVMCEALQVSLKSQLEALIEKLGMPTELMHTVLDLWCMYVTAMGVDFDDRLKSDTWQRSSSVAPSDTDTSAVSDTSMLDDSTATGRRKRRRRSRSLTPTRFADSKMAVLTQIFPWYSLVLCYLGCVMLRAPVYVNDFIRWAKSGDIPYFDSADTLPTELAGRFDMYRVGISRKKVVPRAYLLSRAARSFQRVLKKRFGLEFPPANMPLLWLRVIRELRFPLKFYVDISCLWEVVYARKAPSLGDGDVDLHTIALALVVFKLRCGADAASADMDRWLQELHHRDMETPSYATWTATDIDAASTEQRLTYIDRFVAPLMSRKGEKTKGFDLFEEACSVSFNDKGPQRIQQQQHYPPLLSEPGSRFIHYDKRDSAGVFHEPYSVVLEHAADMVGLSVNELEAKVGAVEVALKVELPWMRTVMQHEAVKSEADAGAPVTSV